jgi:hypothetical protein
VVLITVLFQHIFLQVITGRFGSLSKQKGQHQLLLLLLELVGLAQLQLLRQQLTYAFLAQPQLFTTRGLLEPPQSLRARSFKCIDCKQTKTFSPAKPESLALLSASLTAQSSPLTPPIQTTKPT